MHLDLATQKPNELTADVVIVGAGAAGQTIAKALADAGHATLMIESGGMDYESWTANLNAGECVGRPYYDLDEARLRLFGGTTAIWGGRCAELREMDLQVRPWVPWSGWPFGIETLRGFYDQAWHALGMSPPDDEAPPRPLDGFNSGALRTCAWRIDRRTERFGAKRNADLLHHPFLTVITHATVREIIQTEAGRSIDHLDVRGPDGAKVITQGRFYVIAAGGIENARLLLASNRVQPNGLGNDRDLVGRFFMEHLHGRGGRVVSRSAWELMRSFQKRFAMGHDEAWLLTGSPEFQQTMGALNGAITLAVRRPAEMRQFVLEQTYRSAKLRVKPTKRGRAIWHTYRGLGRLARTTLSPASQWQRLRSGKAEVAIVLRAEQSPNPDSRVRLIRETDALGMHRVALDWRLQRQDREGAGMLVTALDGEIRRLGLGHVEASEWLFDDQEIWRSDPNISAHPIGGYHHIGTTRMADDPSKGVTDGWGRVHGVENLYLAGSSLFPTGGWANPTLTILALALRTAKRLRGALEKPVPRAEPKSKSLRGVRAA